MIVLVKIGHMRLMLPSERGVQTLITALSKAQVVEDDQRYKGGQIVLGERPDVTIEPLPGYGPVKRRDREVLDPEVMPPARKQIADPRPNLIGDSASRNIIEKIRLLRLHAGDAV
jgi:hypothetical protein